MHTNESDQSLTANRVGFWVYFWTLLEWNLAIICNCAPSLRAFFREYLKDSMDKAISSWSGRSRYRETTKGTMASQQNIELRRTYTVVESEKSFNGQTSTKPATDEDASSTSSQRQVLGNVVEVPQAHVRDPKGTFFDMGESPPQFVPTHSSPWSDAKINSSCSGPGTAHAV